MFGETLLTKHILLEPVETNSLWTESEYFLRLLLRTLFKNTVWGPVVSSHARDLFPVRIC
jgi:hypothetical protein